MVVRFVRVLTRVLKTEWAADVLLRKHVDPVLRSRGFVRTSKVYRRYAPNGDAVVVEFQDSSSSTADEWIFYVNLALVPAPWLAWLQAPPGEARTGEPQAYDGVLSTRLSRPEAGPTIAPELAMESLLQGRIPTGMSIDDPQRWTVDSLASAHVAGAKVAELLTGAIDGFTDLLDRAVFKDRLRGGLPLPGSGPRNSALVALLVDEGPSPELDDLFAGFSGRADEFVDWARRYAFAAVTPTSRSTPPPAGS
ncbi:DUF4304 domain-containing protein [Micromonospora sp. DT47]|uniref:DUF4304 domain-containing protein n=1 Tax=Micromonospora sp. DT47 TaxID=3393431 RepID=UPI003CF88F3B